MSTLTIRRATVADALELSLLGASTFAMTFGADNTAEDLADHLKEEYGVVQQTAELADPDYLTLMAYLGTELVGFAQIRRKESPPCVVEESPIEVYRFYLIQAVQGKGVAMPLMHAVCAAAVELGGRHLWLGVWERNPRAVAFYLKVGFSKVGSHLFVVGSDHQTDWVFTRPL